MDWTKLLTDEKFLRKCKDAAHAQKFEPFPKKLMEEHWATMMWLNGITGALISEGYEIVKKKETK